MKWDVPWSRRGTLRRELDRSILEQARRGGEPKIAVRDRMIKTEEPEFSAQIIADALDKMGIVAKNVSEMDELRGEKKVLEAKLAAAEEKQKANVYKQMSKKSKPTKNSGVGRDDRFREQLIGHNIGSGGRRFKSVHLDQLLASKWRCNIFYRRRHFCFC